MRTLLASTNPHKLAEFRRLLAQTEIDLLSPADLGVPALDVVENGRTFAANARAKAFAYLQTYRMPCLADDSGICVDALAGAPGIYSARFGKPDLDDAGRVAYLLNCISGIDEQRRGAHYVCALVLARPGKPHVITEGRCYGRLLHAPVEGPTGFGYDPIFRVTELDQVVSRLSPDQKDAYSHRGHAARTLLLHLRRERGASGTLDR